MKLAVVHLTDFHVRSSDDPIVTRAPALAAAIHPRIASADAILLAITGDISYSGQEGQLVAGFQFLLELQECLDRKLSAPVSVAVVPGNHDCDFSLPHDVRTLLLPQLTPDQSVTGETLELTLAPLQNFLAFRDECFPPHSVPSNLAWYYQLNVANTTILVSCLNTAWCSSRTEVQGRLFFPLECVADPPVETPDVAITLLHHPPPWMAAQNARDLTTYLEDTSDLVLTGHDHVADHRWVKKLTGHSTQYLDGTALHSSEQQLTGFNLLTIDTVSRTQRLWLLHWDDTVDSYTPSDPDPPSAAMELNRGRRNRGFAFTDHFRDFLSELGIEITHPTVGALTHDQIYQYPHLRRIRLHRQRTDQLVGAEDLHTHSEDRDVILITGEEQSGKTSLAKQLVHHFTHRGLVPLFLAGRRLHRHSLRSADSLSATIEQAIADQYGSSKRDAYFRLDATQRVIIIDDFDRLALTTSSRLAATRQLTQLFSKVYLFADALATDLQDIDDHHRLLDDPSRVIHFRIQPFGYQRRDSLIQRWISLHFGQSPDVRDLAQQVHAANQIVATVIGTNLIPAYPVYILGVLQAHENVGTVDLRASANAHYYELFIKNGLALTSDRIEYSVKTSFLATLAYEMLERRQMFLSIDQFHELYVTFRDDYGLDIAEEQMVSMLRSSRLLVQFGESIEFKYLYCYYYFAALYLADNLTDSTVQTEIRRLAGSIYEEESANILLFLTHLSKDRFVLDAMLECANSMFDTLPNATLDKDIKFLGDDLEEWELEFEELGDNEELRRRALAERDEQAAIESASAREADRRQDYAESQARVQRWGAAFKTSQILGQVLKNYPAAIKAPRKLEIARASYGVALRALTDVLGLLKDNHVEIVADFARHLLEAGEAGSPSEAVRKAKGSVAGLARLVSFGVVRRIVGSLGDAQAARPDRTVMAAVKEHEASVGTLTAFGMELDVSKRFPQSLLERTHDGLKDNSLTRNVLQYLVVHHMHLFPMRFDERQRACAELGIRYKRARIASLDPRRKLIGPRDAKKD